ncbi:MAG: RDD family protein [Acidimicrobiales bacterium]|nr:RDD family protein [Acidimicrobiales bacterium]
MNPYRVIDPTDVLWKRVGAYLIDGLLAWALMFVVGGFVRLLYSTGIALFVAVLAGLAYFVATHVVMQGRTGATIGKHLCGLRVVGADGRLCTMHQALVRSLAWMLDGFPYLIVPAATAFAVAMSSRGNQRTGDHLAGTWVVDKDFVGLPPVAVALPKSPELGLEPYELHTMGQYLPEGMDIPTLKALRDRYNRPAGIPDNALGTAGTGLSVAGTNAPLPMPRSKNPAEPRWDPERKAYVRWNALRREWMVFDETSKEWVKAPEPASHT